MIEVCFESFVQGNAYTHIEPDDTSLNDIAVMPDTGLMFVANEAPKILSYYVPVS